MPATRQLAAILFADIQGYTALMQEDEMKARAIRDKFKKELENEIPFTRVALFNSAARVRCVFSTVRPIHTAFKNSSIPEAAAK